VLDNAVKFTPAGRVALDVALAPDEPEAVTLRFAVCDTGVGIPGERQAEVFELFVQVDGSDARRHGGAGLGLAICARLVRMMGGRIWIDDGASRGCTVHFTARFGLADERALEESAATRTDRPSAPFLPAASSGPPLRVLVAEDNPGNQALLVHLLRKHGHSVHAVPDGRSALDTLAASAGRFDVLLLDLQMPEMDGYEVATRLRARESPAGDRLRIVAVTAHATETDRRRCLDAGMDGFVAKPLREHELLRALARFRAGGGP
jgi:CheY-like chemotaxis protein